jgi:ligand-binding SRPBCC domain-containing protein
MAPGTLIDYSLRIHGIPVHWKTEIQVWEPPHKFVDRQLKGPYKLWHHTHTFQAENGGTRLRDVVRYQLPFGPLGDLVNTLKVRRDVETIFAYRHKVIEQKFS